MANNWLEVDHGRLRHNLARLRALVGRSRIMLVVKANAYGAGAVPIAQTLAAEGIDGFAVASVAEAVELREHGIRGPITCLTYFAPAEVDAILEHDLRPVVFTPAAAAWLSERATATKRCVRAWAKVDTGLGRIGVPFAEAPDFVRHIVGLPHLEIEGLLSTMAEDPERNRLQVTRLTAVRAALPELGGRPLSLASTHGILSLPESYLDVVRPGILLLGMVPGLERLDQALVARAAVQPVVTWKARVAYVKRVPGGDRVGYGVRPPLGGAAVIATLAVGWADGYPQTAQGSAKVLVRGRRCPVLAISANSTMDDVTGAGNVAIDDEAVLVGRQGDEEIPAADLARATGSFYRLLATIPGTVPRVGVDPDRARRRSD